IDDEIENNKFHITDY
ncbi:unnamed protein product, partial [Rotaria sordida]